MRKNKKTLQLMKIIKEANKQGIKPYVVIRPNIGIGFKEADIAGLKQGDFYWTTSYNPEELNPEKNAITIFDLRE